MTETVLWGPRVLVDSRGRVRYPSSAWICQLSGENPNSLLYFPISSSPPEFLSFMYVSTKRHFHEGGRAVVTENINRLVCYSPIFLSTLVFTLSNLKIPLNLSIRTVLGTNFSRCNWGAGTAPTFTRHTNEDHRLYRRRRQKKEVDFIEKSPNVLKM